MKRDDFLASLASTVAVQGAGVPLSTSGSDVSLTVPGGTLYGTLVLPAKLPAPVALIVAGSGATDRDGNSSMGLQTNSYALLAKALASKGIASLRYDKRGVGASVGAARSEADLRFDTYVNDAVAWIDFLRADKRFTTIIVCGHSEGSLIGMIALEQRQNGAFVSLEGAGRPAYTVIREQLKPKVSPELYAQADQILNKLQKGQLVPNPPSDLAMLFRPSVQPYLISWFKYDPAVEIGKLKIPVTIVQGTADVQVTMTDANDLKRGQPAARLIVVDGMNHALKYAPDTSSQSAILKGYQDPSLPIDPHVVDAIVTSLQNTQT
jgi:uncharacterized protein